MWKWIGWQKGRKSLDWGENREGEREKLGHGCKHKVKKRDRESGGIYLQGAMVTVHKEALIDEGEKRTGG